jgi:hypothetical protein
VFIASPSGDGSDLNKISHEDFRVRCFTAAMLVTGLEASTSNKTDSHSGKFPSSAVLPVTDGWMKFISGRTRDQYPKNVVQSSFFKIRARSSIG